MNFDGILVQHSLSGTRVEYQCTYGTAVSLDSSSFQVQSVSTSGSTSGVGALDAGFTIALSKEQLILGSDQTVSVDWSISTLKNIIFYLTKCAVEQGDVSVNLILDNCYSKALYVKLTTDTEVSQAFKYKTFTIEVVLNIFDRGMTGSSGIR